MSRRGMIGVAAVVAVGVVGWFAGSAMAGNDGLSPSTKPARTVSVSATATVKTAPNEASFNLGVGSRAANSAQAMAQNANVIRAVIAAVKAAGISQNDIQTLQLSLHQETINRGQPNQQTAFVAQNSIQVTDHQMTGVGDVIDAGVKAGATSVGNISFQVSNPDKVQADALAQAVKASRAKADALAQAAGSSVVSVVTIDQQSFREPVYHAAYAGVAFPGAAPSPVVPPDNLTSSVTVSVVWQIS